MLHGGPELHSEQRINKDLPTASELSGLIMEFPLLVLSQYESSRDMSVVSCKSSKRRPEQISARYKGRRNGTVELFPLPKY